MQFKKIISVLMLTVLFLPSFVHAGGLKNAFGGGSPLGNVATKAGVEDVKDVETVTGRVINAALTLVGIIFLLLMVYGGYMWMTARGNEEQVGKAQKIIYGTIIGLVIILSSYAITVFITSKLTG